MIRPGHTGIIAIFARRIFGEHLIRLRPEPTIDAGDILVVGHKTHHLARHHGLLALCTRRIVKLEALREGQLVARCSPQYGHLVEFARRIGRGRLHRHDGPVQDHIGVVDERAIFAQRPLQLQNARHRKLAQALGGEGGGSRAAGGDRKRLRPRLGGLERNEESVRRAHEDRPVDQPRR